MNNIDQKSFLGVKNAGFTLIELLVVVLIIGILAAVAVPQYQKAVEKARAMQAITLLKSVAVAQQAYKLANGVYTTSVDDLDISFAPNKDYTLYLGWATSSWEQVQAVRSGKFLWFVYYLNKGALYCQVQHQEPENAALRQLCKSFSPTKETCPEAGYDCYGVK